jgi:hypothetical protein
MATKKKTAKKAVAKKKVPVKKKAARRLSLTEAGNSLTVSVEFRLGGGEVTVTQFRKKKQIDEQTRKSTGDLSFIDVQQKDVLSINGSCAVKGKLSTDRNTTPLSSSASPRDYTGNIMDILIIN